MLFLCLGMLLAFVSQVKRRLNVTCLSVRTGDWALDLDSWPWREALLGAAALPIPMHRKAQPCRRVESGDLAVPL